MATLSELRADDHENFMWKFWLIVSLTSLRYNTKSVPTTARILLQADLLPGIHARQRRSEAQGLSQ